MKFITTKDITKAGALTGLSTLFGMFSHFYFLGGQVYLISLILFCSAFFLKRTLFMMVVFISVFLADLYNGYLSQTYSSMMGYGIGMFLFKLLQEKEKYILTLLGTLLASISIILIYYLFDQFLFNKSKAIINIYVNLLQMGMCSIPIIYLYFPLNKLKGVL